MEGREGGRALLCAQQNSEALTPGRFQVESSSSGVSSLPLPHVPQENGKFSQDSQHLPAAPAGARTGRGGRLHSPGTQRLRTPPEGGGTRRSGGLGGSDKGKFQRHRSPELTHHPRRPSPHLPLPPGL